MKKINFGETKSIVIIKNERQTNLLVSWECIAPPKVVLSAPLESTSRSDLSVIINSTSKSTPSRHRFSFSPISSCYEKSPVLSPIEFETQEEAHASTSFMKDQDLRYQTVLNLIPLLCLQLCFRIHF